MRVFFDTNVLVSALTARGLCKDLLGKCLTDHVLITGEVVLDELRRVLSKQFQLPNDYVNEVLAELREEYVEPKPQLSSDVKLRDKDDGWVLASAIAAQADVLVTGDKDLLIVAEKTQLKIVSPRQLWEMLKLADDNP